MALNACELELDLFSRGLRLPAGDDLAMRVAADGGLEVAIPAAPLPKREIYVNVPVVEPFAIRSPFRLARLASRDYVIVDDRDACLYPVRVPDAPPWLAWLTSNDRAVRQVATRHGAQLHIRPAIPHQHRRCRRDLLGGQERVRSHLRRAARQ